MGIEPTSEAWEALNKTLKAIDLAALSFPSDGLNWKLDGNRKRSFGSLRMRTRFSCCSSACTKAAERPPAARAQRLGDTNLGFFS